MCLAAGCLVNANGMWKRAVVINCSRSVGFDIKFIDTGEYNEILDGVSLFNEILQKLITNLIKKEKKNGRTKEAINTIHHVTKLRYTIVGSNK